jgi:nucleotide-binding universal stress UspA family protein
MPAPRSTRVTLVAFHLSDAARTALAAAVAEHADGDALVVVHATPAVDTSHDPHSGVRREHRRQAREHALRQAIIQLVGDVPTVVHIAGAPVAAAILEAARSFDADRIVIGGRATRRRRLPAFTARLLRRADRPVLIVPTHAGSPLRPPSASRPGEMPVDLPLLR